MDILNSQKHPFFSPLKRFIYIYILAYALTLQMSPWGYLMEKIIVKPLTVSASKIFGINIETFSGGSGDTTYDYCKICILLFSSLLIFLGLYLKNRSFDNTKLRNLTFIVLRYFLALYLLIYGLSKVFPLQFGNGIHAYTLSKTYGESSPMNLLWTFMGYSRPYTIFAGLSEVIAGLFLLFRKTTLLGALIAFGVILNVFLLNLFYDVPVKLFSGHLLMFSIFIIGYNYKTLLNFFIFNKGTTTIVFPGFNFNEYETKALLILKKIFVGIILLVILGSFFGLSNFIKKPHKVQTDAEGMHRVLSFEKNGKHLYRSADEKWRQIIIYEDDGWLIENEKGKRNFEEISIDTITKIINDTSDGLLRYSTINDTFNFQGQWQGDSLHIKTLRTNIIDLPLNKRKFNFINEIPFNR